MRKIGRRHALLGSFGLLAAAAHMARGVCLIDVSLDGRAAAMVLDTGAERSILTQQAATRLRLRRDPWIGTTLRGAGGKLERFANAQVGHAQAGGVALFQRTPATGLSLPVTASDLEGADGLLGGDVLRHYTVVLDVPGGRVVLLARPMAGSVRLMPWRGDLLLAPVRLDGRDMTALVDTGAAETLVNARGAFRLGLGPAPALGDEAAVVAGIGGTSDARVHRFKRLQIGALQVDSPRLLVSPIAQAAYDLILGLDVLGRQPVVICYANASLAVGVG